jgi:hypothetical protein
MTPDDDMHGYIAGFRRLIWPALYLLIAVAIAVGFILATTKAAH